MYSKKEIQDFRGYAKTHIIPHYAQNKELLECPKIFTKGEGVFVEDIEGNRYIDSYASLLTTIVGHGRTEVIKAMEEELTRLAFYPNFFDCFSLPQIQLAQKLEEIMPGDLSVSFFVNSGSEGTETAMKMAKQYHWERGEKNRYKVISRQGSYHATTLGGTSACGLSWFKEPFEPLLPGYIVGSAARCQGCDEGTEHECDLSSLDAIKELIMWERPDTVSAVILDPIPGSNSGYPLPPKGYLNGLREFCDEHGILLIFDEVQTGFAKSGKMFACEHWGVTPDILVVGKGFSGGYCPIGAAVTTPKIQKEFSQPGHELRSGSTYGGHNAACAAAMAVIDIIQKEKLVENAKNVGGYIKDRLLSFKKYSIVGRVGGIGMLLAVNLDDNPEKGKPFDKKLAVGNWVRDYCYGKGMIMRNNGDILVVAPAVVMTKKEADIMLDILEDGVAAANTHFHK